MILRANILSSALISSAGIWSVPSELCIFSFSLAISSLKALNAGSSGPAYNRSTCVKQRKRQVERSFRGSHRSQHGGHIRSLVANHITEFKVLLSDLLGNGEVNKTAN